MSFKIPNKIAAACKSCGVSVRPGAGWSSKTSAGKWFTTCQSSVCMAAEGLTLPGDEKRELVVTATGAHVAMPYDAAALPLLRAMPGAKFDMATKCWSVSTDLADRPRVVELADKLRLDVPDDFRHERAAEVAEVHARIDGTGLYPYQVEGVEWLAPRKRALLGDDMGLGKTVQTLMALEPTDRVIVVCKATLKYTWFDEVNKWRPDLDASIIASGKQPIAPEPGEVVILNYERLPKEPVECDVLICDEAHHVKNYKAARTKKFTALASLAGKVWLLTGTPLTNRPFDLWGVLNAANMAFDVFGSFRKFTTLFGGSKNRWGGWEFDGPEGPEVAERLRRVMLRRTKEQVLPELPRKSYATIRVPLTKALAKQLDDDFADAEHYLDAGELPPFEQFSRARRELAEAKIEAAIEAAEEYVEAGEQLVVFSAHRAPVEQIVAHFGDAAVMIAGGVDAEARREAVARFQAGDARIIALTIGSGAEGLTLTAASRMLFVDLDWTPAKNMQAEDRIRRIGQTADRCQYTRLIADHPVDQRVMELLHEKQELIATAVEQVSTYDATTNGVVEETAEQWQARKDAIARVERDAHRAKVEKIRESQAARASRPERELTAEVVEQLKAAYDYMLSVCDGAVVADGVGFSKPDAVAASVLTQYDLDDPAAQRALERLLSRYHRQLSADFPAIFAK